ncbi:MAG: GspE/PulE family protein [Henriciella sp.]
MAEVQRFQTNIGGSLRQAVMKLGLLREQDLLDVYQRVLSIECIETSATPIPSLDDIKRGMLALDVSDGWLSALDLVIWIDGDDAETLNFIQRDPLDTSGEENIQKFWNGTLRQFLATNRTLDALFAQLSADAGARNLQQETSTDVARLRELAEEAPVIDFVNGLLSDAVDLRASDVHIEPSEIDFITRFRVDGVLAHQRINPRALFDSVVTRIKILSNMDISERRLPQDGRQTIRVAGEEVDLRVSSIPSTYGESVVLRLLRKQSSLPDLEGLGIGAKLLSELESLVRLPNGIFLVTGPTGSGKSTTLYRVLELLNNGENKIITIEDPVEYEMENIGQIQVHSEIGLTFAGGLRAMLRHDPDVIMVGEIRDPETAEVSVQAALTGHMVFSTLHTNTAAGAIERLQDLGTEPFLIKASLRGVLGQRLLRRLCGHCSVPQANGEMVSHAISRLHADGVSAEQRNYRKAVGCEHCGHSGYSGRVGVFELLNAHSMVNKFPEKSLSEIMDEKALRSNGYVSMVTDGIEKSSRGLTSLEEIERVFGRWYS